MIDTSLTSVRGFFKYRENISADDDLATPGSVTALDGAEIDMSGNPDKIVDNDIFIILKQTDNGTSVTPSITIYFQPTSGPLNTDWFEFKTEANVPVEKLLTFKDVWGGRVKILLTDVNTGTFDIYVAHRYSEKSFSRWSES